MISIVSMLRYDCHDRGRTVTTAHKSSIHSFEGAVANARIIITCLAKEAHTPSLNPQLELFFPGQGSYQRAFDLFDNLDCRLEGVGT